MDHYINVGYANVYRKPTFHIEIDTQVVLGKAVKILNLKDSFVQISCEEGCQGSVNKLQGSKSEKFNRLSSREISSLLEITRNNLPSYMQNFCLPLI